jgi:hypothetical protein
MSELWGKIREAVLRGEWIVSNHAAIRLGQRDIAEWQVVDGIETARLLSSRPGAKPNPVVEVEQVLADGSAVKVVWAWLVADSAAKLVTVHFFDR